MEGTILGYKVSEDRGVIKGDDEKRYYFGRSDFMNDEEIKDGVRVDFIAKGDRASEVFRLKNDFSIAESSDTVFGLIAVVITLILGFIGTFISRVVLSQQDIEDAIMPTLLHMLALILLIIPFIGKMLYLGVTLYYMYKNYQLVAQKSENKKSTNRYDKY
jgi:hypothetical protein